jgi:RNA polymerase sigma-70 factor (ECF subfamily)
LSRPILPFAAATPSKPSGDGAGGPSSSGQARGPQAAEEADEAAWLPAFHRGRRAALALCYERYIGTVSWAVGQIVQGVDRETVVHEVFYRLFAKEELRRSFEGGNFGAWLITIARRQAIDFRRRRDRELPADLASLGDVGNGPAEDPHEAFELRALVERFERALPAKWLPVFRARFLGQLDQREAARRLGMHRTTLAYQEVQIRRLLRQFVLEEDR